MSVAADNLKFVNGNWTAPLQGEFCGLAQTEWHHTNGSYVALPAKFKLYEAWLLEVYHTEHRSHAAMLKSWKCRSRHKTLERAKLVVQSFGGKP